jgi:hypothetical protein
MPLPCDIIYDKDVPMTLRDGKTIYTAARWLSYPSPGQFVPTSESVITRDRDGGDDSQE